MYVCMYVCIYAPVYELYGSEVCTFAFIYVLCVFIVTCGLLRAEL